MELRSQGGRERADGQIVSKQRIINHNLKMKAAERDTRDDRPDRLLPEIRRRPERERERGNHKEDGDRMAVRWEDELAIALTRPQLVRHSHSAGVDRGLICETGPTEPSEPTPGRYRQILLLRLRCRERRRHWSGRSCERRRDDLLDARQPRRERKERNLVLDREEREQQGHASDQREEK
jgi:hypothetical protein